MVALAALPVSERTVRVRKGQTILLDAGRGAQIEVERYQSGAVEIRNANTRAILRQWTPKEAGQA